MAGEDSLTYNEFSVAERQVQLVSGYSLSLSPAEQHLPPSRVVSLSLQSNGMSAVIYTFTRYTFAFVSTSLSAVQSLHVTYSIRCTIHDA